MSEQSPYHVFTFPQIRGAMDVFHGIWRQPTQPMNSSIHLICTWNNDIGTSCAYEMMTSALLVHMKWWHQHFLCTWNDDISTSCAYEMMASALLMHMKWWHQHFLCIWNDDISTSCAHEMMTSALLVHMKWWHQHFLCTWNEDISSPKYNTQLTKSSKTQVLGKTKIIQGRISSYFRWLTKGPAVYPFSAIKKGPDT